MFKTYSNQFSEIKYAVKHALRKNV